MELLKKDLKIAISGKSGCGNTSVTTALAARLGVQVVNWTFRNLAEERGMTLQQVIEAAKTDDSYDREVDTRQVKMARERASVYGSRLAVWMLDDADLKVFLNASDEVRAKRIFQREGGDFESIRDFTQKRDLQDSARYLRLYEIDNSKFDFCDLVIDTEKFTVEEIVEKILAELRQRNLIG